MMHDHRTKGKPMFCPLLKEICIDGWTPSMGQMADKRRPTCAKWVGVFVDDKAKGKVEEVFNCLDQWTPDLLQHVAQEVCQGAAATEDARNHVAGQAGVFRSMSTAFRALARKGGVTQEDIKAIEADDAARTKEIEHKTGGT